MALHYVCKMINRNSSSPCEGTVEPRLKPSIDAPGQMLDDWCEKHWEIECQKGEIEAGIHSVNVEGYIPDDVSWLA